MSASPRKRQSAIKLRINRLSTRETRHRVAIYLVRRQLVAVRKVFAALDAVNGPLNTRLSSEGGTDRSPERPYARCVASGAMRKIFGVVVFATALIGSASVAPAQSSRDLTEPTGTEANRIKTQAGGSYGRRHRAYAYSPGLHRRWHWSHRRW
jgi:hypothetical protein